MSEENEKGLREYQKNYRKSKKLLWCKRAW